MKKSRTITGLAWKVWARDRDVFMKTWKTNFIPPLFEPILYIFAIGIGLGGFIGRIEGVSYIVFLAPAIVAISIMNSASFECTYGSFVRMYYQRTFDAITATPVSVEEVIVGEMLWGATKSVINAGIVLVVVAAFGLVALPSALLVIPVAFLGGLMFAAISISFTAITPNIDSFNYFFFLFVTPMYLFCGTFFPLSQMPEFLQKLALFLPLTHIVNISRELAYGNPGMLSFLGLVLLFLMTVLFVFLGLKLMRRRLIK